MLERLLTYQWSVKLFVQNFFGYLIPELYFQQIRDVQASILGNYLFLEQNSRSSKNIAVQGNMKLNVQLYVSPGTKSWEPRAVITRQNVPGLHL